MASIANKDTGKYLDQTGLSRLWLHITAALGGKVDKETGKQLSSNDFTDADKQKLNNAFDADWIEF